MTNGPSPYCRGVLLVLAVAHATAAAAAAATTGAPAEAPARARQLLLPRESSLPPPIVPTAAAACAQSVLEASLPCARDVLQTLVFKTVRLSADCCRVLAGVGEECVAAVLSGGSFGPALLPVVNGICGLVASIG
ncbi:hypothetical protein C2845_PM14G17910 [Panicum miliaceum]|uniref:Prolamin-like domain-containing protein n=1 Tax=Panicum miliaceum TaxID=4540 RepID=A0A3L6PNA2_PANMI|nr:hypothetical protein C2845_PM14G17910 [Panicum miliaceum]